MDEEVIPCEYHNCDLYLLKPGKTQCSFEDSVLCGSNNPHLNDLIEKLRTATVADDSNFLYFIMSEAADQIEKLRSELLDITIERDGWKKLNTLTWEIMEKPKD